MSTAPDLILHWLMRTGLEASLLVFLVLALRWTLGRHLGPRWRVALWTLVGIKLLIPATLTFLPGIGQWWQVAAPADTPPAAASITTAIDPVTETEGLVATAPAPAMEAVASATSPAVSLNWPLLIIAVWLIGALTLLTSMLRRQWCFAKAMQSQVCDDPELNALLRNTAFEIGLQRPLVAVVSKTNVTPAVFGIRRPCLLLPVDWQQRFDAASLRHILLHELEHVRFGDVLWNWMAAVLSALHWFNPLVWIARSAFQSDRELRCDADTVARLQGDERLAYGHTLLNVEQQFHAAPAVAGLAPCVRNHPTLRQRITMITQPTARKTWLNSLLIATTALLVCLSFGSAQADGERGRDGDKPREGARDGDKPRERARDGDKSREGARDGDKPREGVRPGDKPRECARDGDKPREGARDGDKPREGARDGDKPREGVRPGDKPREGARDGDKPREGARDGDNPREGARDGDKPREGARDGDKPREAARDGDKPREGARDGDNPREGARDSGSAAMSREIQQLNRIYVAYDKDANDKVTFQEWLAMKNGEMDRAREKRERGWFDEADANRDEAVSLEEFRDWKLSQGNGGRDR